MIVNLSEKPSERLRETIREKMRSKGITTKELAELWYVHPTSAAARLRDVSIPLDDACMAFRALGYTQEEVLYVMCAEDLPSRGEDDLR